MSKHKRKHVEEEEEEDEDEDMHEYLEEGDDFEPEDEDEDEDDQPVMYEEEEEEPVSKLEQVEDTWLNPDYAYRIVIASIQGMIAPTLKKVSDTINEIIQVSCFFEDEMRPATFIAKHNISLTQELTQKSGHELLYVLDPSFQSLEDFWTVFLETQSNKVFEQFPLCFENTYDCLHKILEDHDHFASYDELLQQWRNYELQHKQLTQEVEFYVREREEYLRKQQELEERNREEQHDNLQNGETSADRKETLRAEAEAEAQAETAEAEHERLLVEEEAKREQTHSDVLQRRSLTYFTSYIQHHVSLAQASSDM